MKEKKLCRFRDVFTVAAMQLALVALAGVAYAGEGGKRVATVDIPPAPALYAATPQPLTVTQCAQCHPGVFGKIKNDGGKHRFDCQKCHTTFHSYNPKKGGWEELMPKCASCHTEPHGKTITNCGSCHTDPHTPRKVAMAPLVNACATCHAGPKEQLVKFPSKHTKVACQTCHTSHGFKPSCFQCHKPHTADQPLSTCTKCHPVHKPLQITYEKDVPAATCGSCHTKVYAKWQKTPSKHAKVNCANCHHTKHRLIPQCTECHAAPHNKQLLSRFPNCLTCHLDVHDLPVQQRNGKK